MADGDARSPLGHRTADLDLVAANTGGSVAVAEEAFPAQIDLRMDPAHGHLLAFGLPLEPNTTTDTGDVVVLWLGPDEWLVVGRPWTAADTVAQLSQVLEGTHHSVVDVSAGRAVLKLYGPARHELLSKGCSLDLHPRAWSPGRCAQTLAVGVPVILEERRGSTRVYVRPSFADYLADWIVDATVEYRLTSSAGTGR